MGDMADKKANGLGAEALNEAESNEAESAKKERQSRSRAGASDAAKKWNSPNTSDDLIGPGTGGMTPGSMKMNASVKLHSRLSINLFRGRKGEPSKHLRPIIGLLRFARQVSLVWSASAADDPYADMVLIEIEEAYEKAKLNLDEKTKTMQGLLDGMEEFSITVQASEQPVEVELQFFSPWSYRGAMLLKQFDTLVRMALTARHIGIFSDDDWRRVVHDASRSIRHMYAAVSGWVSTGVTRDHIKANNKVAQRAVARYMDLDSSRAILEEDVLQGTRRAKLSPPSRAIASATVPSEAVKKQPLFGFAKAASKPKKVNS